MQFSFPALGTVWSFLIDHPTFSSSCPEEIKKLALDFESKFSRFRSDSLLSQINNSPATQIALPRPLFDMLSLGQVLNKLTDHHFDLQVRHLLEGYGYDSDLSFKINQDKLSQKFNSFRIKDKILYKHGPLSLDIGSLGKGYLIDLIAKKIKELGFSFFLIEGGGDIYATTKKNGDPWQVALEHPLDPTLGIGQVNLMNQAIATSGSSKRKIKNFHHLLDPKSKQPVNNLLSVSVLAPSTLLADACATALFVSPKKYWSILSAKFNLDYLAVFPDLTFDYTSAFTTALFS